MPILEYWEHAGREVPSCQIVKGLFKFARVRTVRTTLGPGELLLEISGAGDLLLEAWALKRKAGLFAEVFGREVGVVS